MGEVPKRAGTADIEAAIARLRGVSFARAVLDAAGQITEIHIVADESRHPKQISRDVESVLLAELGQRVDHRVISIAQVSGEGTSPPPETRLKFLGIEYSVDRINARARVSLGAGDDVFVGISSAAVGPGLDQERLVAKAALEAVEEFLRAAGWGSGPPLLELRDFSRTKAGEQGCVVATIRLLGSRWQEDLLGSALVRDDAWRAAACAVLDALNRRLPSLGS